MFTQLSYFDLGKSRIITNVGEFEIVDIGVFRVVSNIFVRVLSGCL